MIQCGRLHQVLDTQPELGKLIKRFSLTDGEHAHWVDSCPEIVTILRLLTSCTQVALRYLDLELCSSSLHIELFTLMARPSVSKLALIVVTNINLSILAQYHHIGDLTLRDVHPSAASSVATGACFPLNSRALLASPLPAKSTQASKLSLTVGRCGEALKTLLVCAADSEATLPLLRPRALGLSTSGFDDAAMQEAWSTLLGHCAASVVEYSLYQDESKRVITSHIPRIASFVPVSLPLVRFERLQCIHLHTTYHHSRSNAYKIFPHLVRELRGIDLAKTAVGKPSELTHISLTINLKTFLTMEWLQSMALVVVSDIKWDDLSTLLTSPSFAKMKRVGVRFEVGDSEGVGDDQSLDQVARDLRLSWLGGLSKCCEVDVSFIRVGNRYSRVDI
ncbi:hypothetical protein NMY22_g8778 [Coprinellus aureogranulatus]|nr:hypothetical protein NMY22_g8778 [Coprinellus aureogranulatus]